jgi:hypothetical protein
MAVTNHAVQLAPCIRFHVTIKIIFANVSTSENHNDTFKRASKNI